LPLVGVGQPASVVEGLRAGAAAVQVMKDGKPIGVLVEG